MNFKKRLDAYAEMLIKVGIRIKKINLSSFAPLLKHATWLSLQRNMLI